MSVRSKKEISPRLPSTECLDNFANGALHGRDGPITSSVTESDRERKNGGENAQVGSSLSSYVLSPC